MAGSMRKNPNILVSGTPGTGKSTLCKNLAKNVKELKVIDFGKEAKAKDCREEWDEVLECWVIDEEKVRGAPFPHPVNSVHRLGMHEYVLTWTTSS